jgi:hypothetical protein
MNRPFHFSFRLSTPAAMLALAVVSGPVAAAFNSGSTGADGAFNPSVTSTVTLPESGILNYTTVNIPAGVTVTFKKNTTNTPVVLLASGNVTIAGSIDVSGGGSTNTGAAGNGAIGDDGIPGVGGPGGYAGGRGGSVNSIGGPGLGPGGGSPGKQECSYSSYYDGAGGGGFAGQGGARYANSSCISAPGGPAYGAASLLPLIGGSGGGGGFGGYSFVGTGGGGGGGALLIASSGTINIAGGIWANGGNSGSSSGVGCGTGGGGGSGGAIRLVATTISGNGTLSAAGGGGGNAASGGANSSLACMGDYYYSNGGGDGSAGRIRLEAENFTRTAGSNPGHSFGAPGPVFISGMPSLKITSVAGQAVPDAPTGVGDVSLPSTTANPVTVTFATTGVPVGNTIKLTVTPTNGAVTSAISPALVGDSTAATASVAITLPTGPSSLLATVTYTVVVSMGDALSVYAANERVESVTLLAGLGGGEAKAILRTVSGKEFTVPASVLARAAAG